MMSAKVSAIPSDKASPRPFGYGEDNFEIVAADEYIVATIYQCDGIREVEEAIANRELFLRAVNTLPAAQAMYDATRFLMSQVELLANRAFSEGQKEWLKKCDAYNAGRKALALYDSLSKESEQAR